MYEIDIIREVSYSQNKECLIDFYIPKPDIPVLSSFIFMEAD